MIWDDPWLRAALAGGTRLPPLPAGGIEVFQADTIPNLEEWIALVGTRWTAAEVRARLAGAWIPCLFQGALVATCVLRPKGDLWILETLHGRKGFGAPLLRAVVPWIYSRVGPFSLGYTWELSVAGLVGAWSRGWLASAVAIQYGWSWSRAFGCGFCSKGKETKSSFVVPVVIQTEKGIAVVSDSGRQDGWGHVLAYRGEPDWAIISEGRWNSLWMRSATGPPTWSWTGEFVVVGILNQIHDSWDLEWITAEI